MTKVKRIATLLFGKGFNVLVSFLFLPYMARVLSYEDYGSYGQVLLIMAFAGAILSLGLPQILYIYLSREENKQQHFDSNVISTFSFGVIGGLVLFLFADELATWLENKKLIQLLKLFVWSLPFQIGFQSITSRLITDEKVTAFTVINIAFNLLRVGLIVVSIQLYRSIELVFASILFTQVIQFFCGLIVVKKSDKGFDFNFDSLKSQVHDGLPLGITNLFGTGVFYIDGLMVSRYLGVSAYAIYRNGAIEVPLISTISNSINAVILPEISKLYNNGLYERIVKLKRDVIKNSVSLIYPILIFLLFNAQDFIVIYLGEAYRESAIIFAIFNLTLFIRIYDYQDILMAARRTKVILQHNLIIFALNIILNILLIQEFGIVGAAIATVICLIMISALLLYRNMRVIKARMLELFDLKRILQVCLLSASLVLILYFSMAKVEDGFIRLGLSMLIYFPLVYFILYKFNFVSKEVVEGLIKSETAN